MTSLLALSGVYLTILICSWVRRTSVSPRLATQTHHNQASTNTQNMAIISLKTYKTPGHKKHGNHFPVNTQNTSQLSPNTQNMKLKLPGETELA